MDGSHTLFAEVKDAEEAARQSEVYARAMASIRAEQKSRVKQGEMVVSAMTSNARFAESRFMEGVKMFLIGFAMVMPIVALWTVAL